LGILIGLALPLTACGGDGAEEESVPTRSPSPSPSPSPSGPAVVIGQITINGEPFQGEVGLVPKDKKKVKLEETLSEGTFRLTAEPGRYTLTASATVEFVPGPGERFGPGTDRPCRAEGYSVSNLPFEAFGRYAYILGADSDTPLELQPGDQLELDVAFECRASYPFIDEHNRTLGS
jgi:hypothetical protein